MWTCFKIKKIIIKFFLWIIINELKFKKLQGKVSLRYFSFFFIASRGGDMFCNSHVLIAKNYYETRLKIDNKNFFIPLKNIINMN